MTAPTKSTPPPARAIPSTSPPFAWLESPDAAYRVRVALDTRGRAVALLPVPRRSLVPERVRVCTPWEHVEWALGQAQAQGKVSP